MSKPRARVIQRKLNGWCTASVIQGDGEAYINDTIAIHSKYGFDVGNVISTKVVHGRGIETWFATYAKIYRERTSQLHHESWQVGQDAITLPDTIAGSGHDGIEFQCWGCGHAKVHGFEIHRIKQTAIWTNTDRLEGCKLRGTQAWNKYKKCHVQSVQCGRCGETLGSYYEQPYFDSETGKIKEGQVFPCFKLDHMRSREAAADKPQFSLTLVGTRKQIEAAIEVLITTDDSDLVQPYARFGRIDAKGFELVKQSKVAARDAKIRAEQAAEERKREAADAKKHADAQRQQAQREAERIRQNAAADKRRADAQRQQAQREAERITQEAAAEKRRADAQRQQAQHEADRIQHKAIELEQAAQKTAAAKLEEAARAARVAARRLDETSRLREVAQAEATAIISKADHDAAEKSREADALVTKAKALVSVSTASLKAPLPHYWSLKGPQHESKVVDVSEELNKTMEDIMNRTAKPRTHGSGRDSHGMYFEKFFVKSVQRIENFERWDLFTTKRAQIRETAASLEVLTASHWQGPEQLLSTKLDERKNEFFLFHGTKAEIAPCVIKDGFDFRVCSRKGMLGQGLYFAESASKSDQYTGKNDELFMFLTRVVLGSAHHAKEPEKFVRPPCNRGCRHNEACTHTRCDSVHFQKVNTFREFVVYDNHQCYPEYLIRYERR